MLPPSREPERMREYRAKYRASNAAKIAKINAAWKAANKDKVAGYHLADRYSLTLEEYTAMLDAAKYQCAICAAPVLHMTAEGGRTTKACVDHCHTTGKVRGILCHSCNRQLAFVEAHKASIEAYLEGAR